MTGNDNGVGNGSGIDPEAVIDRLLRHIARLTYELVLRDTRIEQLEQQRAESPVKRPEREWVETPAEEAVP